MNGVSRLGVAICVGFFSYQCVDTLSFEGPQADSTLDELRSCGVRISTLEPNSQSKKFIIPTSWSGDRGDLDKLQYYCAYHAPESEITFLGPTVNLERLRVLRAGLPHARIQHRSAVWMGIERAYHIHTDLVRATRVYANSPANNAGLQVGDLIVGIGEYRWPESDSQDSFDYALKKQKPGQQTTITLKRDGNLLTVPIVWVASDDEGS